jgi:LysM repeat protein
MIKIRSWRWLALSTALAAAVGCADEDAPDDDASDTVEGQPDEIRVRPGDTLSSIARRFGVTVEDLQRANPQLGNRDKILVGEKLKVPRKKFKPTP